MEHLWLWILATLAAFYIKGLCGFANTLIFDSILGFGVNNVNISPVELLLGFPTNVILTVQNRKKLNPKIVIPSVLLILLGSVPGAFLLKNVDTHYIKIVFGVVVTLIGIEMYLRELNLIRLKESKVIMVIIGLLSGVLCGLFGVGVLFAAYMGRITKGNAEFKANLSPVFIFENLFRIVLYSVLGLITLSTLKQVLILSPFMLLGLIGGMLSTKVLDEKKMKKIVIILLVLSGIALVVKSLL